MDKTARKRNKSDIKRNITVRDIKSVKYRYHCPKLQGAKVQIGAMRNLILSELEYLHQIRLIYSIPYLDTLNCQRACVIKQFGLRIDELESKIHDSTTIELPMVLYHRIMKIIRRKDDVRTTNQLIRHVHELIVSIQSLVKDTTEFDIIFNAIRGDIMMSFLDTDIKKNAVHVRAPIFENQIEIEKIIKKKIETKDPENKQNDNKSNGGG